jgi:hypothetical protein
VRKEQIADGVWYSGTVEDKYTLTSYYDVHGWEVLVVWDVRETTEGPSRIEVRREEGAKGVYGTDGLTSVVLRAIPMQHVHDTMAPAALEKAPPTGRSDDIVVPSKVVTARDHALVASLYVLLASQGRTQPLKALAEATGISRETWSARVRRARDMGLLNRPPAKPALTAKARRLLNEGN